MSALSRLRRASPWRVTLAVVVAVAFGLRVGVFLHSPRPYQGAGLAAEQAEIARNIVDHGRWFVVNSGAYNLLKTRQIKENRLVNPSEIDFTQVDRTQRAKPEVDQMPGVALVLAGLWSLSPHKTYTALQWLQVLLDTAMVLLVAWIGIRLTSSRTVALLAGALYAVWPGAIVVVGRPVLDTWACFFTIACTAAFLWARESPRSRGRLVLFGLLTGVGIYFRPFVVVLPLAFALAAVPLRNFRQFLRVFAIPTAAALLVLAPWTIRNYYDFHRFIPTRSGLGQALFEGNGLAQSDQGAAAYVQGKKKGARYGSPGYDQVLLGSALSDIVHHPGSYLHAVVHRSRFLLPCLLFVLVWRRWRRATLIPVAAAVSVVPYLLVGGDTRFYLPAAFAYLILIAMVAKEAGGLLGRRLPRLATAKAAAPAAPKADAPSART